MKLDQFLKWKGWVSTGGEAKQRIQMGEVEVNGSVETRRGRQLVPGSCGRGRGCERGGDIILIRTPKPFYDAAFTLMHGIFRAN